MSTSTSIDLRALLASFGGQVLPAVAAVENRDELAAKVEMTDEDSVRVTASPADVACFIDGVQSSLTLAWRQSRPIALHYAGAGASRRGELLRAREELIVACGQDDELWVTSHAPEGITVVPVEGESPNEVVSNVAGILPGVRERLEREVCDDMLATTTEGLIVCDGSIVARPHSSRVVGIVKTTRSRYLPDEALLWRLPKGWRSPRFVIPAGTAGPLDRHSCYVRLHDASHRSWDFALIRIEAFNPEILDAVAALALADAQDGSRVDARWDRHLRSVRATEDLMRARRPAIF